MKTDHDTIEYRLEESKDTNYNDLDLEMLKLNNLPQILNVNIFFQLFQHVFVQINSTVSRNESTNVNVKFGRQF